MTGIDASAAFLATARIAVPTARFIVASVDPWFARYEALSAARVAAADANLSAGTDITAAIPARDAIVVDRVITLDLAAGEAAAMFWRNLATWGSDAVVCRRGPHRHPGRRSVRRA